MAEAVDGIRDPALTWSGRAMDVGLIETELGKLRYMAAGEPAGGEGLAMRTSLLNMVVYAEHEEGANNAGRVIEDLASHHPSRALIVIGSPSARDSRIEAQLAAHCHVTAGREQTVCCEEVTLRVSGKAASHLHSLVVPLMIPDLPVYVWWTEGLPSDTHALRSLLRTADRLIVDSARFTDPLEELQQLAALAAETSTGIGDLAWDRFQPWRQILQQQQQISEMRHHLSSVKSVEVRYAKRAEATLASQGFLFLAWLAQELGWDTEAPVGHSPQHATLTQNGQPIEIFVEPVDYPTIDEGWLVSVKIACESDTARALLLASRTGDPYHVTVRTEHKGRVTEDHLRIEQPTLGDALVLELDVLPHDTAFVQALRRALPVMAAMTRAQS